MLLHSPRSSAWPLLGAALAVVARRGCRVALASARRGASSGALRKQDSLPWVPRPRCCIAARCMGRQRAAEFDPGEANTSCSAAKRLGWPTWEERSQVLSVNSESAHLIRCTWDPGQRLPTSFYLQQEECQQRPAGCSGCSATRGYSMQLSMFLARKPQCGESSMITGGI